MNVWIQNPFDSLPAEGHRPQRYWLMARAFVAAGHTVTYWTSDFSHARKAFRAVDGIVEPGVRVRAVATPPYPRNVCFARLRSHAAYAAEWTHRANGALAAGDRPDLIVTSIPTVGAAAAALAFGRRAGARVVADVQDAWPETFFRLAPRGFRWAAALALSGLRRRARRVYREADRVSGVCDRYRDLTGRADYRRAYLGIACGHAGRATPAGEGDHALRLVYVGNLGVGYDLETVLRGLRLLRAGGADVTLDVAGFGDARGLAGVEGVTVRGMLDAAALARLLAGCDIGIVPMRDESWVGVPNKLGDYAAAGLAVVSSLGGESADLLRRYACGAQYAGGDAENFATAVRSLAGRLESAKAGARRLMAAELDAKAIYGDYVKWATER